MKQKCGACDEPQDAEPPKKQATIDVEPVKYHQDLEDGTQDVFICETFLTFLSIILFIITLPFSLFFCIKIIPEYQRALVFRLGRMRRKDLRGPGLILILACIDEVRKVDLRTITLSIPPQKTLTRDSVAVQADSVVYYHIFDPATTCMAIRNYNKSIRLIAMTVVRTVISNKNLSEVLSDRENMTKSVKQQLDDATEAWGIRVERVELTDVKLPDELQKAMAAEAEAVRESRAKVITAEGELRSARALRDAGDIMRDSPISIQVL